MKKLLQLMAMLGLMLGVACSDDATSDGPTPGTSENLQVVLKKVNPSSAEVEVTTVGLKQVMFLAVKADSDQAVTAAIINNKGRKADVPADGTYDMVVGDLQVNTAYVIHFAGITNSDEYTEIIEIEAQTEPIEGTLNIFDIEQRAFKMQINLPEETVAAERAFRWRMLDLATYNMLSGYTSDPDAVQMVSSFDPVYPQYVVKESKTIFYDNQLNHMCVTDENGELVYSVDEEGNKTTRDLYDPLVPGEVLVMTVGEYSYGRIDDMISQEYRDKFGGGLVKKTGDDYYDIGYYIPMFDWVAWGDAGKPKAEAPYWTGFYYHEKIKLEEPEVIVETQEENKYFNVNYDGLLPYGGSFTIIPSAEIPQYTMVVMSDYDYQSLINGYLEGDEGHLRWFLSSWAATNIIYAFTYDAPYNFIFKEEFVTTDPDVKYHLMMVGYCDSEGTKQVFRHDEFFLPEPKEAKPEIVITALEDETTANEIVYNVKCTTKNAVTALYACNYTRDWMDALYSYGSNLALIATNGQPFSSDDVKALNSDEGVTMRFWSREDADNTLGVVAYNLEEAPSDAAISQLRSKVEDPATKIESDYYTELQGDWTATTTITYMPANSNKAETMELKRKVTLGDMTYPSEIPSEFKEIYASSTNGYRGMWEEFTTWTDHFNQKNANQNRILCQGFDFQVPAEGYTSDLIYQSAYDLMISEDYAGFNTEATFWDFGPKWYFEVQPDGTLAVPFNYAYFAPMCNWGEFEYHVVAIGEKTTNAYMVENQEAVNGYFPVEVSEDKNTITIKPANLSVQTSNGVVEDTCYMNAAYYSSAGATMGWNAYNLICSDIVLTRGWNEADATAIPASKPMSLNQESMKFGPAKQPKARTAIQSIEPIQDKELRVVTTEQMKQNVKTHLRSLGFDVE